MLEFFQNAQAERWAKNEVHKNRNFFDILGSVAAADDRKKDAAGYVEIKNGKQVSWEFTKPEVNQLITAMLAARGIVFKGEDEVGWMKHNLREIASGRLNTPGVNQELKFNNQTTWVDWVKILNEILVYYPYDDDANINTYFKRFFQGFGNRVDENMFIKEHVLRQMEENILNPDVKNKFKQLFGGQGLNWLSAEELARF